MESRAEIPDGVTDYVVRTIAENGRTLRFTAQEFQEEWERARGWGRPHLLIQCRIRTLYAA